MLCHASQVGNIPARKDPGRCVKMGAGESLAHLSWLSSARVSLCNPGAAAGLSP